MGRKFHPEALPAIVEPQRASASKRPLSLDLRPDGRRRRFALDRNAKFRKRRKRNPPALEGAVVTGGCLRAFEDAPAHPQKT